MDFLKARKSLDAKLTRSLTRFQSKPVHSSHSDTAQLASEGQ
jgi:hypothetical protein